MAIRFVGSFTVVDDAPNPDVKIAPINAGSFSLNIGVGSEFGTRAAEVLQPLVDAEAAHLAALQAALAAAGQ